MLRLAAIIWIMLATTLAGSFTLVVVSVPALADQGMRLISLAAAAGALVAAPAALAIARKIRNLATQGA